MNTEVLINQCYALGVVLAPGPGGKLRVSPPGRLPEALREELKQHRAEIIALLNTQPPSLDYRSLYRQVAEDVQSDCFAVDAGWLIEVHPELWECMVKLDTELNQMEQQGMEDAQYRQVLARLMSIVKEAWTHQKCVRMASKSKQI